MTEISVGFTYRRIIATLDALAFALRESDDGDLNQLRLVIANLQQAKRSLEINGLVDVEQEAFDRQFDGVCRLIRDDESRAAHPSNGRL